MDRPRRSRLALVPVLAVAIAPAARAAEAVHWIGTWAASPQRPVTAPAFRNQTLRLIVHTSVGGKRVRVRISNAYGAEPLLIGAAHVARRSTGADVDPASDRALTFDGHPSTTIGARGSTVSDPVSLEVPALSDLAVSLFLPERTKGSTTHLLALQTSYVSPEEGDATGAVAFPLARTITSWPFLTGVDVAGSGRGGAIVAFGSSTTDGDGSSKDANRRWPDVLAERLWAETGARAELGVLNAGIIGNRLLCDFESPRQAGGPFAEVFERLGPALGEAGVARFERDVVAQPGVRYLILALGINDILFPGSFVPATEAASAESLIAADRQLVARARKAGIRVIATTLPPVQHAFFREPRIEFFTTGKESVRRQLNAWILGSREFDGVVDLDAAVRDPEDPARLRPEYDSGDHLHVNDAGNVAQGNAFPLALFGQP